MLSFSTYHIELDDIEDYWNRTKYDFVPFVLNSLLDNHYLVKTRQDRPTDLPSLFRGLQGTVLRHPEALKVNPVPEMLEAMSRVPRGGPLSSTHYLNLKDLSNELTEVPNLPHEYEDLEAKQFCSLNTIV